MMRCLPLKLKRSSSCEGTTSSSTLRADANVARSYSQAVLSNSYGETWSTIQNGGDGDGDGDGGVVQPSRECVEEVLRQLDPGSPLTELVSSFFEQSETTARLCLSLRRLLLRARTLYAPLHDLLRDSSSGDHHHHHQCDPVLRGLDSADNPFSAHTSLSRACSGFSDLRNHLDSRRRRRRPGWGRLRLLCRSASDPGGARLKAAAKGTFVLYDLHTIDCLVELLRSAVEDDKSLARMALEAPPPENGHLLREVLGQLRRNHLSFPNQLDLLDEQICLCLHTVNRARSTLLCHFYHQ